MPLCYTSSHATFKGTFSRHPMNTITTKRALSLSSVAVLVPLLATAAPTWSKRAGPEPELLASMPMSVEKPGDWALPKAAKIVRDEILRQDVLEVTGRRYNLFESKESFTGPYAIEVLARLHDAKNNYGYLWVQGGVQTRDGRATPSFSLTVIRYRYSERGFNLRGSYGAGKKWEQPDRRPDEPDPWESLVFQERYLPSKISPLWEEDFRKSIESDMARLPLNRDVWHRIRIEFGAGNLRVLWNGMLVGEESNRILTDGRAALKTLGDCRIGSVRVLSLREESSPGFVPVALSPIANAAGPIAAESLPAPGHVQVEGIPFEFTSGRLDHVDIGESIFRCRKSVGGMTSSSPRSTWPTIGQLDPGRLRLRLPRFGYRRIWILAGSDGEPDSTPVVTARFYKPQKGWPIDSAVQVPELEAKSGEQGMTRLEVKLKNGKDGNLWLIPIPVDTARLFSDHREEPMLHLELTKEVKDYRSFPDPMNYGSYQGGLPSGVRVYALTLEKSPVTFISSGSRNGNVFVFPERPTWNVDLNNQANAKREVDVKLVVVSPGGEKQSYEEAFDLAPAQSRRLARVLTPGSYGLHRVLTTVICEGHTQEREATFLALPPDTRTANAKTSRWGVWCWKGGHGTNPNDEENLQLLRALGSLIGGHIDYKKRRLWGIGPNAILSERGTPKWAFEDPYDVEEYNKFSEEYGKKVAGYLKDTPDLGYVSIFAEHSISLRVTHGNPPYIFQEGEWFEYTDQEKASIRAHLITAKAAYEGLKKHAPKVKFLFGHCGPQFSIPFMRAGYPKDYFDGYGLDAPQFERMPERPPRAVEPNHLFFLMQEEKRGGYDKATLKKEKKPIKEWVHTESYYPSSHPLALGHRGSADSLVRTAVLSLALGTDRFFACWTLHDCEGYWGSQHYGCNGLISRRPEYNPKPAAAAFATMTQVLDAANYDGWLPTGSRSAYCVRFKKGGANWVYALWTIRGERPLTLSAGPTAELIKVDENGNETPLAIKDGNAVVSVTPTAIWVKATKDQIKTVEAGTPVHRETLGTHSHLLTDFSQQKWADSSEPYPRYAENNWDVVRQPGKFEVQQVESSDKAGPGKALQVALKDAPSQKPFVSWYTVLTPEKPIPIPGKAYAITVLARGNSGWGRIIYEVQDAKGEIFQSVGTKDDWNCDDVHSWGYFNFDGWRHLEFPLPSHSPGDNYREKDMVWWNHSDDEVVDLPLKLTKVIIEMQSHQIYVNEVFPVENPAIELGRLSAVYRSAEDMTDAPIRIQRAAKSLKKKESTGEALPNPIADLQEKGVGPATSIVKLYPPQQVVDGTQVHVSIKPVEGATSYQVWLSAYPDGRGAIRLVKSEETEPLARRLRPEVAFFLFVTYMDAEDKESKPSAARRVVLKDEFPMK